MYQDAYPLDVKGKTKIQSEIEKSVGLTYQLFINSIMFGQGLKRLIQESNTDKKKLFEEVFDLNFLNLAKGVANDERRDILVEANEIENKANQLKHQVEESKNTYFELRERERSWKATIHRQRRELRERRTELTRRLQETQRELKDSVEATLDSKISRTESRLNSVSQRLKKAKGDTQLDLEDFVTEILKMLKSKKYQLAYKKLQTLHATFKEITECQEEKEQLTQRKYKLKEIKTRYVHINKTCNTLADNICEIDEQIRELENEKQKVLSPKYKKAWENYRKKLKKADEDYHNKLGELENYDWLITEPLGNNGIKAYLFDSSLDLLNHVLESYSEILGFRVSFEVDLDSARKEFVTLIESNGIIIEYDELSG
jgi:chromosome segregation ATPase